METDIEIVRQFYPKAALVHGTLPKWPFKEYWFVTKDGKRRMRQVIAMQDTEEEAWREAANRLRKGG